MTPRNIIFILLLFVTAVGAQDFPAARGFVNDFGNVISPPVAAKIEALCYELREKTGAEMAVATFATIGDEDPDEYANRLFAKWGLGKKGKDNGVLLVIMLGERKRVRIETGYGLEGILPDITAGRILNNYVIPQFRRKDYDGGLLAGAQAIAGVIAADAGVQITGAVRPNLRQQQRSKGEFSPVAIIILFIIVIVLARSGLLGPLLLSGMFGGGRGRHSDWGSGGFGGGFGGGGFGGFGGGGSGGGGASSDW